jgi:hypothetical protein
MAGRVAVHLPLIIGFGCVFFSLKSNGYGFSGICPAPDGSLASLCNTILSPTSFGRRTLARDGKGYYKTNKQAAIDYTSIMADIFHKKVIEVIG